MLRLRIVDELVRKTFPHIFATSRIVFYLRVNLSVIISNKTKEFPLKCFLINANNLKKIKLKLRNKRFV